ncbi:hypothetical protein LPJ56_006518, partial [Coemansia sp. RSA 2599]
MASNDLDLAFSHIALVTDCEDLFQKTVEFYQDFGLSVVRHVRHDVPQKDVVVGEKTSAVTREAWLHLFGCRAENSVTLRVVQVVGEKVGCEQLSNTIRVCLATQRIK